MRSSILFIVICIFTNLEVTAQNLKLNNKGYLSTRGLDITFFDDIYPEGHQTGVSIIQHGERVIANGDLRLEISPGQWSPVPKGGHKTVDTINNAQTQTLWYPDSTKNRRGFNPVIYPDLLLKYDVKLEPAEGNSFKITVDLDEPIPSEWIGKIGFNMELFPGHLFGKSYIVGEEIGVFTPSPNGPVSPVYGEDLGHSLGKANQITVAPEDDKYRVTFSSKNAPLELWDGRINHNNSWFIIRSTIPAGKTKNALEWIVDANVIKDWTYQPVIQASQVGYHPHQQKIAILETDPTEQIVDPIFLYKHSAKGKTLVKHIVPDNWGNFLRYNYYQFDFTEVQEEGIYSLKYKNVATHPFQISTDVYDRGAWQPVLEYYLPVQMCHMRINEKYRVWHDQCHMDDALMTPIDTNHFDGYIQRGSTLTDFNPYEVVPQLNKGGWHDAGDYDLRVESQMGTVRNLAYILEEFDVDDYDATSIDQEKGIVEIHQPDGKSDILQQIEHGLLSVLGGYRAMGRLYRGIICNDLRQYVMLGDAASMTDNVWKTVPGEGDDDRWVFTEENPNRELQVVQGLAAASRVLKASNPSLSRESLEVAEAIYMAAFDKARGPNGRIMALIELVLATESDKYIDELLALEEVILQRFGQVGWALGRTLPVLNNRTFTTKVNEKAEEHSQTLLANALTDSPYGVPYRPNIWGAGWNIQSFGVQQYFFYKAWPQFNTEHLFVNALNFVLGVHPGINTASFASGVGSKSALVAYGVNRGDWSYIPGGVASGTALIRPDLPEFKVWPFFWTQTEYVMGGGSTNYMFLALAVRDHFKD